MLLSYVKCMVWTWGNMNMFIPHYEQTKDNVMLIIISFSDWKYMYTNAHDKKMA